MPDTNKNILLAADEPQMRKLITTIPQGNAYNVLEAVDGKDALQVANDHSNNRLDLLPTDVVMPYITDTELAYQFQAMFP